MSLKSTVAAFRTPAGAKRALAAVSAILLVSCTPGEHTFIRVASGPAGGSWYPLGAKLAEEFEGSIPGVAASAGPGAGVVNIRDVGSGQA